MGSDAKPGYHPTGPVGEVSSITPRPLAGGDHTEKLVTGSVVGGGGVAFHRPLR